MFLFPFFCETCVDIQALYHRTLLPKKRWLSLKAHFFFIQLSKKVLAFPEGPRIFPPIKMPNDYVIFTIGLKLLNPSFLG